MSVQIVGPFDASTPSTTIEIPGTNRGNRWHEIVIKITDGAGAQQPATGILSGAVRLLGANTFTTFVETVDVSNDNSWNPFLGSIESLQIDSTIVTADRFLTVTINSWSY